MLVFFLQLNILFSFACKVTKTKLYFNNLVLSRYYSHRTDDVDNVVSEK